MNIRDYSSQFSIYVFSKNVDLGTSIKAQLSYVKYDSAYFENENILYGQVTKSPPHILVFEAESISGTLSEFVEKNLNINPEIKFIMVSDFSDLNVLMEYSSLGLDSVILKSEQKIDQSVLWRVDKLCEKLYFIYQNEQLLAQLESAKSKLQESHWELNRERSLSEFNFSLLERIKTYKEAESKEALIQKFCEQMRPVKIVYFKFLNTINSFMMTNISGYSSAGPSGAGFQLSLEEMKDLNQQIGVGLVPPKAITVMSSLFGISDLKTLPLFVRNTLDGFFIYDLNSAEGLKIPIGDEHILFSVLFDNFWMEKKVDSLEVQDFVTELYNYKHYMKSLNQEVARSKRSLVPVSVLKVAIDHFMELDQSLGEVNRDSLLRSVGSMILKSSRANDLVARSQMNEISMILPNCSRKGAILRAERVRRMIEAALFLESGVNVHVSIGASEFPTLADSEKMLEESSQKALHHISQKGGNKICLYKPPESFKPIFEVDNE